MRKTVDIKFRLFFERVMLDGFKTMTCRSRKYGEPGDTFNIFNATFQFTHVMRMRLGYVATDCFEQEGCPSVQAFMEVWSGIHPVKGFDKEEIVWAHCFKRVDHP